MIHTSNCLTTSFSTVPPQDLTCHNVQEFLLPPRNHLFQAGSIVRLGGLYMSRRFLKVVVQEVEGRLFSEGLHVLGQQPRPDQMKAYLGAYFGPKLPEHALEAVAAGGGASLEDLRRQLEHSFIQVHVGVLFSAACLAACARCWCGAVA